MTATSKDSFCTPSFSNRYGLWCLLFVLCLVVGALLGLKHGLANTWDLANYHIYNPWALLHHRMGLDWFAAGIQGYFDPVLDLPYYFISFVWLRNDPHLVAALTGLPFGLLLFAAFALVHRTMAAIGYMDSPARVTVKAACTVMAVSGASVWSQAFTDMGDVLTGSVVLFATLPLLSVFDDPDDSRGNARRALLVGTLLGLAAGLKLTSAIYAPAAGIVLLAAGRGWKRRLYNGLWFFVGWLVLFAILYGPWAIHLYKNTGDPFFPFFNNVFHSGFAATTGGRDLRFMPHNTLEWLFYPFYWLNNKENTVFVAKFRDARFALAFILGTATCVFYVIQRAGKRSSRESTKLVVLIAFWAIGYITWLVVFSILRYAVSLEVVAAVIVDIGLVYIVERFVRAKVRFLSATLVVILTIATIAFTRPPYLGSIAVDGPAFQAQVPKLRKNALIILANQPMGLLAPLISKSDPGASFIGIPGGFKRGGAWYEAFYGYGLGYKMRHTIMRHAGPMYVAYYATRMPVFPQLGLFGVTLDTDKCDMMSTNRTAEVLICQAGHQRAQPRLGGAMEKFRMSVMQATPESRTKLAVHWIDNTCSAVARHARFRVSWRAPDSVKAVRMYVSSPYARGRRLLTEGGQNGGAVTREPVAAGLAFVFTDSAGHVLAKIVTRYRRCSGNNPAI